MARKKKEELGSERPFADLSPDLAQTVEARARERAPGVKNAQAEKAYVAGQGPRPDSFTPALGRVASLARDNRDMAAGTAEINNRVDTVRSGQAPNWSGYLSGRGVSDDRIRQARALSGRTNAPTQPAPFIGNRMDPVDAQSNMIADNSFYKSGGEQAESYKRAFGSDPNFNRSGATQTSALTDAQRADPAYRSRVESALSASTVSRQRQQELEAIRQQVQNQRYAEALAGRGRGIQDRAIMSRQYKDDRIATRGLNPQDRASVLLDRRGLESGERMQGQQLSAQQAAQDSARRFEADQNAADRGSAEKIAQTRANAPAGNRGNVDEANRKAWTAAAKNFDPLLKELGSRASSELGTEDEKNLYRDSLRAQQAIADGYPVFRGDGQPDGRWLEDQGLKPGDVVVMVDENGYPYMRPVIE